MGEMIKKRIKQVSDTAKMIYEASHKYFYIFMFLTMFTAFWGYVPLMLWRRLFNDLNKYIVHEDINLVRTLFGFAIGYCICVLIQNLSNNVMQRVSYKYNDDIEYYIDNLLIDKLSEADLSFFDNSDMADKLRNKAVHMRSAMQGLVISIFHIGQCVIKLILSLVLLCSLGVWLLPIIILLSLPKVIFDKKAKEDGYRFSKEHDNCQRRMEYYKGLFV